MPCLNCLAYRSPLSQLAVVSYVGRISAPLMTSKCSWRSVLQDHQRKGTMWFLIIKHLVSDDNCSDLKITATCLRDQSLHVIRRRHAQWDRQKRRVKRAPRKFKRRFQSSRTLRKTIRLDIPFIIRRRKPARYTNIHLKEKCQSTRVELCRCGLTCKDAFTIKQLLIL